LEIVSQISSIVSLLITVILLLFGRSISKRLNLLREKLLIDNQLPGLLDDISSLINKFDTLYSKDVIDENNAFELCSDVLVTLSNIDKATEHITRQNDFNNKSTLVFDCQKIVKYQRVKNFNWPFLLKMSQNFNVTHTPDKDFIWQIRVTLSGFEKELKHMNESFKITGHHG